MLLDHIQILYQTKLATTTRLYIYISDLKIVLAVSSFYQTKQTDDSRIFTRIETPNRRSRLFSFTFT